MTYSSNLDRVELVFLKKVPLFFFATQKIRGSFIDPKKSLLAKISDKKLTWTPMSLKYASGAPGEESRNMVMQMQPVAHVTQGEPDG